jgi:hypothetical protein
MVLITPEATCPYLQTPEHSMATPLLLQPLALLLLLLELRSSTLVLEASRVWDVTLNQPVPELSPTRSRSPRRPLLAVSLVARHLTPTSNTLVWSMVVNVGAVLPSTPILLRWPILIAACLVTIMLQSTVELVAV